MRAERCGSPTPKVRNRCWAHSRPISSPPWCWARERPGSGRHRWAPRLRSRSDGVTNGPAFLDGLGTDFVAVVADADAGTLVVGVAPGPHRIFAAVAADGSVRVSNQCTVVARSLGVDLLVDRSYEDFLLAYGFLPDGRTPFAGVRAIGPGTVVIWPGERRRAVVVADSEASDAGAPSEASTDQLYSLLTDAVAAQAGPERDQAVLLGGVDSALVAAILRGLGHRVHTFTFGFGDPAYDQRNVDLVTESLGCQHTWVPITPDVIGDGLRDFAHTYNQPVPQPHYLLHTLEATRRYGHRATNGSSPAMGVTRRSWGSRRSTVVPVVSLRVPGSRVRWYGAHYA